MANTYTQIFIQIVFAVKNRERLISRTHKEELQKYITGIVQNQRHKMIAIKCMPDHSHVLVGLKPYQAISDLVREIKASSSGFINERNWCRGHFEWQTGFGAFSYAITEIDAVIDYINHQEEHHRTTSFRDEYLKMLQQSGTEFNEKYIFRWDDERETA